MEDIKTAISNNKYLQLHSWVMEVLKILGT